VYDGWVKTPNLERMASEGLKFTDFHTNSSVCSPTRAGFLTGRYQQRAGGLECAIGTGNVGRYDDAIRLADRRQLGLPADQTVIPGVNVGRVGCSSSFSVRVYTRGRQGTLEERERAAALLVKLGWPRDATGLFPCRWGD